MALTAASWPEGSGPFPASSASPSVLAGSVGGGGAPRWPGGARMRTGLWREQPRHGNACSSAPLSLVEAHGFGPGPGTRGARPAGRPASAQGSHRPAEAEGTESGAQPLQRPVSGLSHVAAALSSALSRAVHAAPGRVAGGTALQGGAVCSRRSSQVRVLGAGASVGGTRGWPGKGTPRAHLLLAFGSPRRRGLSALSWSPCQMSALGPHGHFGGTRKRKGRAGSRDRRGCCRSRGRCCEGRGRNDRFLAMPWESLTDALWGDFK